MDFIDFSSKSKSFNSLEVIIKEEAVRIPLTCNLVFKELPISSVAKHL